LASARLEELDADGSRGIDLAEEATQLTAELEALAEQLTEARVDAGKRFGAEVTQELTALAMPDGVVSVRHEPLAELGPHGRDEIELRLAPHLGAPDRPLARGASGGELSRVMLAVEVVFAGADPVPTFVFDEVDAGVGGRAAVEVGARLARLAR